MQSEDRAGGTWSSNKSVRRLSVAFATPTKGLIIAHQEQIRTQASSGRGRSWQENVYVDPTDHGSVHEISRR